MKRSLGLLLPLALCAPAAVPLAGCKTPTPQIQFTVAGKLDGSRKCPEQVVSGVSPRVKSVRLSVRFRDDKGIVKDARGKPVMCDATIDPGASAIEAIAVPAGAKTDLFVEAFGDGGTRIATGQASGVDLSQTGLPNVRLLPVETFSCLLDGAAAAAADQGHALRLAQHRAFHSATTLPNGQILLLGGITTNPTALDNTTGVSGPEAMEKYFATGSAEVYDPATRTFLKVTDATGSAPRAFHHVAVLGKTDDGKFQLLVAGGLAPRNAAAPVLTGAPRFGDMTATAPVDFRLRLDPTNATAGTPEVLLYDPNSSSPLQPSLTHVASPANLAATSAAFQAGAAIAPFGLAVAGGLQFAKMPPSATASLGIARDDKTAAAASLAAARSGAAMVMVPSAAGDRSTTALVVGGIGDPMDPPPAPFERIDLLLAKSTAVGSTAANLALYLFPTLVLVDPANTTTPRVLIAGGLEVQPNQSRSALEPPSTAMQVLKYAPDPAKTIDSTPVQAGMGPAAWMLETKCNQGKPFYRPVAWNAALLLYTPDGILNGDRVLSTGGTPRRFDVANTVACVECDDPADTSHTCAVAQTALVTVPSAPGAPLTLEQTDALQIGRFGHTLSILPDHTVLVAGGLTRKGNVTTGATEVEIYNPARATPIAGPSGDADDPLQLELAAAGYTRKPGLLAVGADGNPSMTCAIPHK